MDKTSGQHNELTHLLKLAAPVSLSLLGGLLMQLVDTIFVGKLGPTAIGGVSVGNAFFATLMVTGIGLLMGLDYLASHAFGARRLNDCHEYLIQALIVSAIVSLVSTIIMWAGSGLFAAFGIETMVAASGATYLRWLSWSIWPFLFFSAFRQYLQAMGIAMPVLVILLVANVVNAAGNWVFVFGKFGFPALGVAGSALATIVARVFMLVAIVAFVYWHDRRHRLGLRETPWHPIAEKLRDLVRLGIPSGLQMLFEVGVFATATLLAGRLGAIPLAAHQIVLHLASLTFMLPLGLSSAAAVRVGQAIGAGERPRAIRTGWVAIVFAAVFAVVMGLAMYALSGPLLRIFTDDARVLQIGSLLLLVAALFQVSDGVQVISTGVLRGIGNTRASMVTNLVGHWAIGLPVGALLCFTVGWGALGLWIGLSVGLTAVAATLLYFWRTKSAAL